MNNERKHLSQLLIVPFKSGYTLHDFDGVRVSFHRTKTGALRARRKRLEVIHDSTNDRAATSQAY